MRVGLYFELEDRFISPRMELHLSRTVRERFSLDTSLFSQQGSLVFADFQSAIQLAYQLNQDRPQATQLQAAELYAAALIQEMMHLLLALYREEVNQGMVEAALEALKSLDETSVEATMLRFLQDFPPTAVYLGEISPKDYLEGSSEGVSHRYIIIEEMFLLHLANSNPAMAKFQELFDDSALRHYTIYPQMIDQFSKVLEGEEGFGGQSLLSLLQASAQMNPDSLQAQLDLIRGDWKGFLGTRLERFMAKILRSFDYFSEIDVKRESSIGDAPSQMIESSSFTRSGGFVGDSFDAAVHEYEAFSSDLSWMPRVVLLAKSTYVWLDQLSKQYQRDISKLDQIPDEELDELAKRGFTGLWLIGLWERSRASKTIKNLRGDPDAVASAYALYDYEIAADLGGDAAYAVLKDKAWQRGIRLASDMVPNHVGIDGRWVIEHPDWFLQVPQVPFPSYSYNGPDLCQDERISVYIEDHYFDKSDAAVTFKRVDNWSGESRYIYHGNDGTSMPWNDTAQLDYLNPDAREAVIQTILHVARKFPIIRFDAAMTLAKKHIQRLWFPEPGAGGAIPSRAAFGLSKEDFNQTIPHEFWREVVDRVAEEVPDTLLLAEAFWMMEGYFVRTLGMHRVYNSAFMNMLKREENAEYRQSMKNVLEFDPYILKRFVNFMNNPDEETAIAQFGRDDKFFGVSIMMSTLPGLPMFGHGQVEGYTEKYGMEYRRAKYDEQPDRWLLDRHYREVAPLLHRRQQFAEVDHFLLYNVETTQGYVDENVFAYSNQFQGRASLVLYNNSYSHIAGSVKSSVFYAVKEGDNKRLVSKELAEGLSLKGGEHFTLLKDLTGGMEYIRRSQDVIDHGLYFELGSYQYHVFVDIHEVLDNSERLYTRLHQQLQGLGVPSIAEAIADMRLAPLHQAYQALLATLADDADAIRTAYDNFLNQLEAFGAELPEQFGDTFMEGLADLEFFNTEMLIAEEEEALTSLLEVYQDSDFVKAYATLYTLVEQGVDVSQWKLPGVLAKHVNKDTPHMTRILELCLVDHELDDYFATLEGRQLLAVNHHEGVDWFNREAFRSFVSALFVTELYEANTDAEIQTAIQEAKDLLDAEERSGYDLKKLLAVLQAKSEPAEESLASETEVSADQSDEESVGVVLADTEVEEEAEDDSEDESLKADEDVDEDSDDVEGIDGIVADPVVEKEGD